MSNPVQEPKDRAAGAVPGLATKLKNMEEKDFVNFKGYSKIDQIKNHLENRGYITGLISMQVYKVYRLSSVINRLRNRGMNIKTVMIKADMDHASYAKYYLNKSKTNKD